MLYLVLLLVLGSLGLLLTSLRGGGTIFAWASVGVSVIAALLLLFDWAGRRLAADAKNQPVDGPATDPARDDRAGTPGALGSPGAPGLRDQQAGGDQHPDSAQRQGEDQQDRADETGTSPARSAVGTGLDGASAAAPADIAQPGTHSEVGSGGDYRPGRHLAAEDTTLSPPLRPGYRTPSRTAPAGPPGSARISLDPAVEPPEEDSDAADVLRVAELSDEVRVLDERPRYHLAGCSWVGDRFTLPLPVHEARELGFSPCALCAPDSMLCNLHRKRSSAT